MRRDRTAFPAGVSWITGSAAGDMRFAPQGVFVCMGGAFRRHRKRNIAHGAQCATPSPLPIFMKEVRYEHT